MWQSSSGIQTAVEGRAEQWHGKHASCWTGFWLRKPPSKPMSLNHATPRKIMGEERGVKIAWGEDPIQSTDIPYLQIIANNQQPLAGSHPDLNQLPHFQAQIESGPWLTRGSSAVIPAIYTLYGLRRLVNQEGEAASAFPYRTPRGNSGIQPRCSGTFRAMRWGLETNECLSHGSISSLQHL